MEPREFLKQWREAGREELSAVVSPSSLNEEERTIDCLWYSGVDVARIDPMTGKPYVLRFDPAGVDLSLLNAGAPVFDNHNNDGAAGQLGVVLRAWEQRGQFFGTLRFKRSTAKTGPRPEFDGLWQDLKDRIVTKFSMGVEILEASDEHDKAGRLTERTATLWRPFELSVTPIPADFGTTTLRRINRQPASLLQRHREREVDILRLQ